MRRVGTSKNLKTSFLPGPFPVGFPMGMVAHGGPLITAGGVVFQGATTDNFIRAYDINNGSVPWEYELPAGGHGSLGTTLGDSVVAFKLK